MQTERVPQYIVEELGRHRSPEDIILIICQKTGMKWPEAERLVMQVKAEHQPEIARKQNGVYRWMTIICLLLGPIGTLGAIVLTLQGHIIFLVRFSAAPVGIPLNPVLFLVGISMSLVGITGLIKGSVKRLKPTKTANKKESTTPSPSQRDLAQADQRDGSTSG